MCECACDVCLSLFSAFVCASLGRCDSIVLTRREPLRKMKVLDPLGRRLCLCLERVVANCAVFPSRVTLREYFCMGSHVEAIPSKLPGLSYSECCSYPTRPGGVFSHVRFGDNPGIEQRRPREHGWAGALHDVTRVTSVACMHERRIKQLEST